MSNVRYIDPGEQAARLVKARTQLIMGQPFYGTLALTMPMVMVGADDGADDGAGVKLACDGERLEYSAEYIASLGEAELQGALAMAVSRVALQHHCRRGDRDAATWQRASELVSNPMLRRAGFTLPEDAEADSTYDGKSAEEAYALIYVKRDDDQQQGQGQGNQPGSQGNQPGSQPIVTVKDAPNPQEAARDAKIRTLQAAQAAKGMGSTSDDIECLAKLLREPSTPWRALLRDFMEQAARNDFSWARPNRRHVQSGIYLPTMRSMEMSALEVQVDTSGSLREEDLQTFGGEIRAIVEDLKPERVTVVYFDTKVQRVQEFERGEEFELSAKARGGTDFRPAFERLAESGDRPACVVVMTDLDCTRFPADPGLPVLWIATGNRKRQQTPPWGEVVQMGVGIV